MCQIDTILVGSTTSNSKTTCRLSCPANLVQVSNLIIDPCFQVQSERHIERAFYLPYCYSLGFEPYFFVVRLPAGNKCSGRGLVLLLSEMESGIPGVKHITT